MEKTTQLSVTMENVPGQLARLCRILAQAKVNIHGISVSDATDLSTIRLCVSNPADAKKALREAGLQFTAQEVLTMELADKPGALEDAALRLSEADVNIQYVYGTAEGGKGKAILVLRVDDADRARQTLSEG